MTRASAVPTAATGSDTATAGQDHPCSSMRVFSSPE